MQKLNSIILKYFRPKQIEYYRDRTIYDLIGIKFYKKYLPTTGDLVSRKKGIKQIDLTNSDRYEELYRYEKKTRNYEWRHIIGAVLFVAIRFLFDSELRFTILDFTVLPIMNLYINIYPIFLQRYNRIRILKILKNNNKPSPYSSIS
jgi:glycosyl-4,4'-diaponeurosporenoate acyltransferase